MQDFYEKDHDSNSLVSNVNFENSLLSLGQGFSLQFGGILKFDNLRLGLSYDSPQWISIADETQQKISSFRSESGIRVKEILEPNVINSFSPYELRIPAFFICRLVTLPILFPRDFAATEAIGIMTIANNDSFQFW